MTASQIKQNLKALIRPVRTAWDEEEIVPDVKTPKHSWGFLRSFAFGLFLGCALWLTFLLVRAWDLPFKGDW